MLSSVAWVSDFDADANADADAGCDAGVVDNDEDAAMAGTMTTAAFILYVCLTSSHMCRDDGCMYAIHRHRKY